jgi:sec-independent protein translocase protein TatB
VFNLGAEKILVIFFIALLVVGPDKLPDLARKAGRALGDLRRMSGGFQDELRRALDEPLQTFTREFSNPGSSRESDVDGVEVSASAPAGPATDTPAEPDLAEGGSLPPAGAHQAPERLGPVVQPVPSVRADPVDESGGAGHPAHAELPAWVFGTTPPADTPQFH